MTPRHGVIRRISEACALTPTGPEVVVSSRVWRLPTTQGDVAMKIFDDADAALAHREAAILAHLGAHPDPRIRVQRLLQARDGRNLITVDGYHALLTRWDTGSFITYDRIDPAGWQSLGRGLAVLHLQLDSLDDDGLELLSSRLQAIDPQREHQRIAVARAQLPQQRAIAADELHAHLDTCTTMLERHLPRALAGFPHDDAQHPIHNDYNQFNYLFSQRLPPLILDWEAAIGAPREFEIVRCLNHLPLQHPALARAFIHAYLQVRPLQPARMAWAVDAALLMHARKHWLLEGWIADPEPFQTRLLGAIAMTAQLSHSYAALVDFHTGCTHSTD